MEVSWDTINAPGADVELGSGDLNRAPKEALVPGASPFIHKKSRGASRLAYPTERWKTETLADVLSRLGDQINRMSKVY